MFEFHDGSIQAFPDHLLRRARKRRFNSTMVRFKLAKAAAAVGWDNVAVSIPRWFDSSYCFRSFEADFPQIGFQFHDGSIQALFL